MKQGYIKTLEAVIAIIVILSFVYFVLPTTHEESKGSEKEIGLLQRSFLEGVRGNDDLRSCVIGWNDTNSCRVDIFNYLNNTFPNYYSYNITVCNLDLYCEAGIPSDRNVYVSSTVIVANASDKNPKAVRVYTWE